MNDAVTLRSGCKVNLDLHITSRRDDGYHEIDSLFLPLEEPHDELVVTVGDAPGITVTCAIQGIDPTRNTVTRAYDAYAEASGFRPPLRVELRKGVPHGAGLGGGSANAAAILNHLESIAPHPLGRETLCRLAARIGADVPFFIHAVPCRASGIGEIITPVAWPYKGFTLLLACPQVQVSTAWAYGALDAAEEKQLRVRGCLTTGGVADRNSFSRESWLHNSFEPVVFASHPELRSLKEALLRHGAAAALMSGSGASVFALFRRREDAEAAFEQLKGHDIRVYQHLL
ncbi:MAG TPA: 4-(cytidine 5'-diphospho)-2-C-methyl-D-erythritol kinase [Desulfovibrio sp.]|jgi:4-diphosphocytidyl-2-C-methyl-D-erythritol kinase|uniref:4-(cytidine 5'-diphospho)-2-C-methyl-D-erythritol kinase n=1 Tax=Nitratidesulfovibrio vulgaris TaxID=881 RepID=UPI000E7EC09F|nr:4-(cytidine 5'-diphospho)-2-C-methyl-D-erythritol kinase [Nitratidesulfovibrio vulgaris]HBW16896.1 4-(cytidine 5'-diphospho)-2-C-methyl-D-erythritol kinase [Desulfovibrio sp.]